LVHRVVRLITEVGTPADRIFCVTFSKGGADEMTARIRQLGVGSVEVRTWHAFCGRVLREEGLPEGRWTVDDKDRAKLFTKDAGGFRHENWKGMDLTKVRRFIGICKANLWDADSPEAATRARKDFGMAGSKAVRVFSIAQGLIEAAQLLTFDDMLVYVARYFARDDEMRQRWAAKFDYVLTDEAQDNNVAQVTLARMLAKDHRNLMVVGDPGQAIFGFRGSSPAYLTEFPGEWDAKVVTLSKNYRSGKAIVDVANAIIREGAHRLPDDMTSERGIEGKVEVVSAETLDDEASELVDFCKKRVASGQSLADVTVLFRLNAQSRALEEALLRDKMPYVLIGGVNFYERKSVKDLLAYLRLAAGKDQEGDATRRCINAPFRFLGAKFVERVMALRAADPSVGWTEIVEQASRQEGIQQRQRDSAGQWVEIVEHVSEMIRDGVQVSEDGKRTTPGAAEVLQYVLNATGYIGWLEKEEGEESIESSHAADVREMVRVAASFKSVGELLDFVAVQVTASARNKKRARADNCLTMMSVHRCVSPDTIIETQSGIETIEDARLAGTIATAEGAAEYGSKVGYEEREMLRLTTKSGYSVEVTEDHGMMAYSYAHAGYVRMAGAELKRGDFLRLRLGVTIDVADAVLPALPDGDVRARKYVVPLRVDLEIAEFFGLMVADGTLYKSGCRLKKRHRDVTARFAELAGDIFGADVEVTVGENTYDAEVNSTLLAAWLRLVGGMGPKQKRVPECILRSSLASQARFLRGLFEDGTVNVDPSGRLDHVSWSTCYPRMAKVVQTMLLRFGIIAARKPRFGQWRVEIYGSNAHKFRDAIGFVSGYKNGLLRCPTGLEEGYVVPVNSDRLPPAKAIDYGSKAYWARQNGKSRGYVSRHGAKLLGFDDLLAFHHDRIVKIERFTGPAMCVEVPLVGRFLQDGFDGCNSKGLEWPIVWLVGCNDSILPHAKGDPEEERRLMYVAATRARDHFIASHVREMATRVGLRTLDRSEFLDVFPGGEDEVSEAPTEDPVLAPEDVSFFVAIRRLDAEVEVEEARELGRNPGSVRPGVAAIFGDAKCLCGESLLGHGETCASVERAG
jgi:DNA helicase-2/ATP-dependent DNA helicase PcrA